MLGCRFGSVKVHFYSLADDVLKRVWQLIVRNSAARCGREQTTGQHSFVTCNTENDLGGVAGCREKKCTTAAAAAAAAAAGTNDCDCNSYLLFIGYLEWETGWIISSKKWGSNTKASIIKGLIPAAN